MNRAILLLTLTAALTLPASAEEPITKPIRTTWIATSCETWNCAAAAMVLADGNKYVIVLPTGHEQRPWLVLQRVEEGSVYIPEDEPFTCDVFDTVADAAMRFDGMDTCRLPLILNVPDGRAVITSLSSCTSKTRAVR